MIVALPGRFSYLFFHCIYVLRFRSKAVPMLRFFYVCASVVSYVAFILSLFVPHLSFLWYLEVDELLLRDCGISGVSSYIFFYSI